MAEGLQVKVEFNSAVRYYALDEPIHRNAQFWLATQEKRPGPQDFAQWLQKNGGQLNREDGPAVVDVYDDGSYGRCHRETWYRRGEIHREKGPAVTAIYDNGFRYEAWFSKGQQIASQTYASLSTIPGVSLIQPC